MVERVKEPWKTSDGQTFKSRAEAEKHEGQIELTSWVGDALRVEESAAGVVTAIKADSALFVALLRKAGILVITRKRKTKKAPSAE